MKENKCVESSDSDYFYRLIDVNGVLNSLDIDDKMMIIYIYASRNDLLTAIRGENDSRCSTDGAGLCNVLTYENFKKILKVYGFDDIDLSKLDLGYEVSVIDNDLVFSYGGSTCDSYLKNDVVFSKVDDNIVLTDKMEFFHNETGDLIKTVTRDYIFKTYEENGEVNYYLYSVETK